MIPPDQIDTPEKRAKWERLFKRYRFERRWAVQNFLKIRTKDQKLKLLDFNSTQDRLLKVVERQEQQRRPVRVIVVKPRKVGISTAIQAIFFQTATSRALQKGFTVAHDMESTQEMFSMSDLFYSEMPYQIRPMKRYSSRDEITFENPDEEGRRLKPGLRSQLKIGTAGKVDLGRSKDIHLLHCSELPFWPDAEKTELSLLNAVPMLPSTMVFKESTPQGVGNKFHRDYEDAKAGRSAFEAFFEAWQDVAEYSMPLPPGMSREEFEDSLDDAERKEQKAYNLTLEQLHWRRWCIENNCGRDPMKFLQEYPSNDVDCFLVSGRPKFDPLALRDMLAHCIDPVAMGNLHSEGTLVRFMEHSRGFVRMWKPPKMGGRYVIGGDVAEGLEHGDFSVGHVWDWDDNEMVAEWHGHIDPDSFGIELAALGRVYNDALIACESNKDGGTVNTRLYNDGYPYIYYRQDLDRRSGRRMARRGFRTDTATKPLMINTMIAAIRDGVVIPSRETISEMMTFVIHDDGTIGAQSGCFDDRVIASCIAQEARKRQGIDRYLPSIAAREREEREEETEDQDA